MGNASMKLVRDIRFLEREAEDRHGAPTPDHVGSLYPVLDLAEAGALGTRHALKLAERGFRTPGYDHVYVTLTPALPDGEASLAPRQLEEWFRYVDVGMPLRCWPRESAEAQRAGLLRSATRALKHLCALHRLEETVLAEVEREHLEQRAAMELTRLVKRTAAGTVQVSFQARPYGTPSPVYLSYEEHLSGRSGKIELLRLDDFEDVFPLIASAGVSRGTITLKPRTSFRARMTTRHYRTPITVPLDRVLDSPA